MAESVATDNIYVQDKSFELSTDDSGFLNFASSGLDRPKSSPTSNDAGDGGTEPSNGTPDNVAPSPMPPSSTSMDASKPPSRPTSAEQGDEDGARALSPMSSDQGPDARSTDAGFEKTKSAGGEDTFKKPVENLSLEEVGNPAVMPAGVIPAGRADPMSWVTLLYEYSQGTSMHGIPYITHSARFVMRRSALSSPAGSDVKFQEIFWRKIFHEIFREIFLKYLKKISRMQAV